MPPGAWRDFYPPQCRSTATLGRLQAPTCTGANSGIDREFWIDLTASSAVNFPITSAGLRLVVIGDGSPIKPLRVCRSACTTTAHFHDKFRDVPRCHSGPSQKR